MAVTLKYREVSPEEVPGAISQFESLEGFEPASYDRRQEVEDAFAAPPPISYEPPPRPAPEPSPAFTAPPRPTPITAAPSRPTPEQFVPQDPMRLEQQHKGKGYDIFGGMKELVRGFKRLPKATAAAIASALQGYEGASVIEEDFGDFLISQSGKASEKAIEEAAKKYKGAKWLPGIDMSDVVSLPESLAASLTSAAAGIVTGLGTSAVATPIAGWAAGTAAAGTAAYQMTGYEIMKEYLMIKNEESREKFGREISLDEEKALKKDFASTAKKIGLWEAIPEAVGQATGLGIVFNKLVKMSGRAAAVRIVTKLAAFYGEEELTEMVTYIGTKNERIAAGLDEGAPAGWTDPGTYSEAFRETMPQTFLLTTIMGGAASGSHAVHKNRNARKDATIIKAAAAEKGYETMSTGDLAQLMENVQRTAKIRSGDQQLQSAVKEMTDHLAARTGPDSATPLVPVEPADPSAKEVAYADAITPGAPPAPPGAPPAPPGAPAPALNVREVAPEEVPAEVLAQAQSATVEASQTAAIDIINISDVADAGLTSEAEGAITNFVGVPREAKKTNEPMAGVMDSRKLEDAFSETPSNAGRTLRQQLNTAFAPVREKLREVFGGTVTLYRNEFISTPDKEKTLFSYSLTKDFPEHLHRKGRRKPQVRYEIITPYEVAPGKKSTWIVTEDDVRDLIPEYRGETVSYNREEVDALRKKLEASDPNSTYTIREDREDFDIYERDTKGKLLTQEIPVADIVWITDRAGQKEVIVKHKPAAAETVGPTLKTREVAPEAVPEAVRTQVLQQQEKAAAALPKVEAPEVTLALTDKINGITRETAGNMIAAGDVKVLDHIREGVTTHGARAIEHVIRNQITDVVARTPKAEREAVRKRIRKLQPQIDELLKPVTQPVTAAAPVAPTPVATKERPVTKKVVPPAKPEGVKVIPEKPVKATPEAQVLLDKIEAATPPKPVKPAIAEKVYAENRAQRRSTAKTMAKTAWQNTKDVISEAGRKADKYLGVISTRLKNIDPELKYKVRNVGHTVDMQFAADTKAILPLLKTAGERMSKEDRVDWDYARDNSDSSKIKELIAKYDLQSEHAQFRQTFDKVRKEGLDVGLDIPYIEDYFSRVLKDHEGFLKKVYGMKDWDSISRKLKAYAEAREADISEIDDATKADLISDMLLGRPVGVAGPGPTKARKIDVVPPELERFYMDTDAAQVAYLYSMRKAIEARKFFGKVPARVKEVRKKLRAAETKRAKLQQQGLTEAVKYLESDIIKYKDYIAKFENQNNFENHIGAYINDLMIEGKLDPSKENVLRNILMSRFHEKGMSGIMQAYKNLSYIDVLGGFDKALTQIQDLSWALFEGGLLSTMKHAALATVKKSGITREDVGITRIAKEFADAGTLGKAVAGVFKLTGLEKVDTIGKETLMNVAYEKYRKRAKTDTKQLRADLTPIFGKDVDKVIEDLRKGNTTDDIKYLVWNRLADFQPISETEVPEGYLKLSNWRILYMLQTFTIKQMDIYRNEVGHKLVSSDRAAQVQGVKDMVRLAFYFVAAGAGADTLKDLLLGREIKWTDTLISNLYRLGGVSKFLSTKARREGIATAAKETILPPTRLIDNAIRDVIDWGDQKGLRSIESVPGIGSIWTWRWGRKSGKRKTSSSSQDQSVRRIPTRPVSVRKIPTRPVGVSR